MQRIMLITDGPFSGTGFSEEMLNVAFRLVQTGKFEIIWYSLQHTGYPDKITDSIFPSVPHAGSSITVLGARGDPTRFGADQFPKHYTEYTPDAVLMMGDPHCIIPYVGENKKDMSLKRKLGFPFYFYVTLDGLPVNPKWYYPMTQCNLLIAMTRWAQFEYAKTFAFSPSMVHHGVNWNYWANNPELKAQSRKKYGISDDITLVINWDVNQHRKRIDALLRCWKDIHPDKRKTKLLLYTDWRMENKLGWDLENLIAQYDIPRETILSPLEIQGAPKFWDCPESPEKLLEIARMGDIYASTTSGEGSGKCGVEAMSLGMPVEITDYSACSEMHKKGSLLIPTYPGRSGRFRYDDRRRSVEGGIVDEEKFAENLLRLIENPKERMELGEEAREWAREFDYDAIILPIWIDILETTNPDKIMMRELLGIREKDDKYEKRELLEEEKENE